VLDRQNVAFRHFLVNVIVERILPCQKEEGQDYRRKNIKANPFKFKAPKIFHFLTLLFFDVDYTLMHSSKFVKYFFQLFLRFFLVAVFCPAIALQHKGSSLTNQALNRSLSTTVRTKKMAEGFILYTVDLLDFISTDLALIDVQHFNANPPFQALLKIAKQD